MNNTNKSTDQLVLELLAKVEAKKSQIGHAERPAWRTNCVFGYDNVSNNNRINLQVAGITELVHIHAFLMTKYTSYKQSLGALSLTEADAPFKWLEFTYNDWVSDIQTRLNGLRIKVKRDELSVLEAKVNALVSPEQRRTIELEKLVREIGA